MNIVLAGQLRRVYSNALACRSEGSADRTVGPAQGDRIQRDRPLFHRAGTLAALGKAIMETPDWYPLDEEQDEDLRPRTDLGFVPGMPIAKATWTALYEDAAALVKVVAFLNRYSKPALATMAAVDAPGAWVEDDSPRGLQRGLIGAPRAYLAELLMQSFLAWHTGAILLIAEEDRPALADVGSFLREEACPKPFPIPDLRDLAPPYGEDRCGRLLNLRPETLSNVEADRANLTVCAYAQQVAQIMEAPSRLDLGSGLQGAQAAARQSGTRLAGTDADIALALGQVSTLSNVGAPANADTKALKRWRRRRFTPQRMLVGIVG